jgi:molybdate transport system regulatory protein
LVVDTGQRHMDVDFAAYLRAGKVTFDETDAALLRAIDESGSLHAAADALDRSYSRIHKRLDALESELGPLLDRQRGGSGGGGSALTHNARAVLARFARLRAALDGTATVEHVVFRGEVTARDGELVTVDTDAGELRALAAGTEGPVGEAMEVTLTADSVTLHDPAARPGDEETSARNRLSGVVEGVDEGDAIATVGVDVGAATPLSVLVTAESRDRLGLVAGVTVAATFKATAARATPLAAE